MTVTSSWAWAGSGTWPGFRSFGSDDDDDESPPQDQIANGAGLTLPGTSYRTIAWRDNGTAAGDGYINDIDTDDHTLTSAGDRVAVNGITRTVQEIGTYTGSTLTINGRPHAVTAHVWLFTDGTYMVRLADASIPAGHHYSSVDSIRLGTYNPTEVARTAVASYDAPFLCFAAGTLILTPSGERPVEAIRPGALVETLDRGPRPVRWTGRRRVAGRGAMAPVRIEAGALGNRRDLRVSPQHRMLVRGARAELLFGVPEVLVAAVHLADGRRIRVEPCPAVTYVHLLLDAHEILVAEGCPSESFHWGHGAEGVLDAAQRLEVATLFPELLGSGAPAGFATARPCLRRWEARALLG